MMKYLLLMLIAPAAFAQGQGGFGHGGPNGGQVFNCGNSMQCYQQGQAEGEQQAQQADLQRRNSPMMCQVTITSGFQGGHPPGMGGPGGPGGPGRPGGPGPGPQMRTFSANGTGETQTVLDLYDQADSLDPASAQALRGALKAYQYTCNH